MAIKKQMLPVIPIRGFVIFPKTVFHFDIAREKSKAAVEVAIENDGLIFLTSQKDETVEEPTIRDIYTFGTIAKIRQLIRLPDGCIRILVEGMNRGKFASGLLTDGFYHAEITQKPSSVRDLSVEEYAGLANQINLLINDYIEFNPKLATESFLKTLPRTNPSDFCDSIAFNLIRSNVDKQTLLEITNVKKRLLKLIDTMAKDVKVFDVESIVASRVKEQMEENNHDYYLREQLKAIRAELGEDKFDEIEQIRAKIESIPMPDEVYEKAVMELRSYEKLPPSSPESTISRHYLDLICSLPWETYTEEIHDLKSAESILNRDHYGMNTVKRRIIEQLAVINRTNSPSGSILCLLGAPGVGKTSVAKSIAEATGRNYVRISLGGMKDESELRGHRKTYVGAMPGRIVNALKQAKSSNPLILLDEIDKIGADYKGDPSSALLEILDSEQNYAFRDNFLEVGLDLSKVLFIATANDVSTIPAPLLDRLEIIELSSYTFEEKLNIAKKHLVPKQLKRHNLDKKMFRISDKAILEIIHSYTRESGVRKLEREIASLCRKCVVSLSEGKNILSITDKNLCEYLGIKKYTDENLSQKAQIGIVNGLAWTSVGGELLKCEAVSMPGTGKIQITGKLGDVMRESAQTAVSFIRTISDRLNIDPNFYKERDIHIHFPEGAVPKDGPSAGITVATAVASALSSFFVRSDIAMTGEISLTGKVLKIGGLKEKVLAAYRHSIREIIIPQANLNDLEEIPANIRDEITFYPVENCTDVLNIALVNETHKTTSSALKISSKRRVFHEYS